MMVSDEDRPANLCRAVNLAVPRRRLRPDLIHRPGDGTSPQAVVSFAARICVVSLLCRRSCSPIGHERRAVDQHPVQDNCELAGQCHFGLSHPAPRGQPCRPALER